ncbi:MAG: hypothetical protein ACMXYC_00865 [Candidatus Woesearchaeota archaeon]
MDQEQRKVPLTYEMLFEQLRLEKNNVALQKLPADFYSNVALYMHQKLQIIQKNMSGDSVFAQKEFEDASKQLANAKKIVKMIYDLREKKIVSLAMNKSRTSSTVVDTAGIHIDEKEFFKQLVDKFEVQRKHMLETLLSGKVAQQVTVQPVDDDVVLVRFLDEVVAFSHEGEDFGPFMEEDIASLPVAIVDDLEKKHKVQRINV